MTRLTWDERDYEVGLDRGVLYLPSGISEPWNGLVSVRLSSSDSDIRIRYIDGRKTQYLRGINILSGVIEAYTYPDSFFENVLIQKRQPTFGLSYRVGHDIHLIYNILLLPSEYEYRYSEVDTFSWAFTTKPTPIPEARPSSHLIIDTSTAYSWTVSALEDALYGTETETARLPSPEEVFDIFEANSIVRVIDHGDGTFTVAGPDEVVRMIDETTFEINWPSVVYIDSDTYKIRSL